MGCYGQDWASYQSPAPDVTGLSFVFVKATEGLTYANPRWAQQVAYARLHKLTVGHYHYPHMGNSATAEADFFLRTARPQPGDYVALDWEGYDVANRSVPFAAQVAYKKAFLAHVTAALPHNQVGTYCNTDYLDRDPAGAYGDFLWIATANKAAGQPGISRSWLFHQYSASSVDRDYCNLSADALRAWAHAKEDDMALTRDDAVTIWGYENPTSGDKYDMHQALKNAEANSAEAARLATEVKATVDHLAVGGVDLDALAAKVADLLSKRLQS